MLNWLGMLSVVMVGAPPADDAFFETKIRPVLANVCVRCHGPQKASGGLRLDSAEGLSKGSDSGEVVVPGKPPDSLLFQAVKRLKGVEAMPPDKPLKPAVVADLERWIRAGAVWPARVAPIRTAARHWAFKPVRAVKPPGVRGDDSPGAIDRFIAARRAARGLKVVGLADRRTLIRRATFDLTGLPPTPAEVAAFLRDNSPSAFARVVDRLLASPHYGERWGRHWLDVVRYADTAGETADFPVRDAWRYRNYVISAFNKDKPYDEFLREQIAGDILAARLPANAPRERYAELITATGYISIARRFGFDVASDHYLTLDDTIDTLGKSVLGLTIGCARCHDHKYDPISAADYYALYGIFDSTRYPFPGCEKTKTPRDMVPLMPPRRMEQTIRSLQEELQQRERRRVAASKRVQRAAVRKPLAVAGGDFANGGAQDFAAGKGAAAFTALTVKKGEMVQLTILPKANHAADSTLVELVIAEVGGRKRVWDLTKQVLPDFHAQGQGNPHADSFGNAAVWYYFDAAGVPVLLTEFVKDAERTPGLLGWRGAGPTPFVYLNTNDHPVAFVTVRQPARSFAAHPGPRGGVAIAWQSPISGTVAVRGRVQDIDPSGGDGIAWKLEHRPGFGRELGEAKTATAARVRAQRRLEEFQRSLKRAYAVVEGRPHNARIHVRGDPASLGKEVPRRFLQVLGGQKVPRRGGSGRLELAGWLTDPRNPLTARVMVNRIWQGHFGAGLVKTPNDFGTRGEPPTHPELLDYLAARFVESGWSIKALHRLIMVSATYQRASASTTLNARLDPDNVLLWRFQRRRLSAEEIRDAILAVSGDLDRTSGGPHPFPPERTWGFTQHAPFAAVYDHNRRSVYLMTQRIKRHPFLALFDGPDASASTGVRYTTTVPTQALFFMNDPFVHTRSTHLAQRLLALPDDRARLERATRLLFGRPPSANEQRLASRFLAGYATELTGLNPAERSRAAWAAWLRVLLNSNEFVYVD